MADKVYPPKVFHQYAEFTGLISVQEMRELLDRWLKKYPDADPEEMKMEMEGDIESFYISMTWSRLMTDAEKAEHDEDERRAEEEKLQRARQQLKTLLEKHPQLSYEYLNEA